MVTPMKFLSKILNMSCERALKAAGDLFIYEGDYEAALQKVEETLALNPSEVRALVLRGDILYCLNRDAEAIEAFDAALSHDGENVEAWISKAGVLDAMGKPREALLCCHEAFIHISSRRAYLLPSLFEQNISLLIDLKRYRQAKDLLNAAERQLSDKDFKNLLMNYGYALDNLSRERHQSIQRAKRLSLRVL